MTDVWKAWLEKHDANEQLREKPDCKRCGKPVDRFRSLDQSAGRFTTLEMQCHGDTLTLDVTPSMPLEKVLQFARSPWASPPRGDVDDLRMRLEDFKSLPKEVAFYMPGILECLAAVDANVPWTEGMWLHFEASRTFVSRMEKELGL